MGDGGKRLGVGSVLGRSFHVWGRNVVSFSLLYAFVFAPLIVYGILAFPRPPRGAGAFLWYVTVLWFGWCLLWFVAPLALIHGVLQELQGDRATLLGCLRVYLTRIFPAIGGGLLVGTRAFVAAVIGAVPAWFLRKAGLSEDWAAPTVLLLPILVGCTYWVAVPVAAAERRGPLASMRRAAELTRGSRLAIFLVVLVTSIVQFCPFLIARLVAPRGHNPIIGWTAIFLVVVLGSCGAVATTVAYHDLRTARDGVGVEDLARVFA
ncbi:MAG TPA: hypothetical protein VFY93_09490 [Planctomycetota bacterium]|nr:hypothetical protein [Planctomycetota bacterium]